MALNTNCQLSEYDFSLYAELAEAADLLLQNCGGVFPHNPLFHEFLQRSIRLTRVLSRSRCRRNGGVGASTTEDIDQARLDHTVDLMLSAQSFEP